MEAEVEGAAELGVLVDAGLEGTPGLVATASFGGRGALAGDFWVGAGVGLVMIIGVCAAGALEDVLGWGCAWAAFCAF